MTLIFETHATSVDNEAGLASGWFDVGLSAAGEQQALALGDRRRHDPLAAVYCSDLTRAFRTAELAFAQRAVPIIRDARLRECHYGDMTRRPTSEIDRVRSRHVIDPFPGGESYQQAVDRVGGWLADVTPQCRGAEVLVIGHRATFYALEHLVRGVPIEQVISAPWAWQPGWTYVLASA